MIELHWSVIWLGLSLAFLAGFLLSALLSGTDEG